MGKVVGLISSTRCAAPVITHWLKVLGKGNMGNGVTVLSVYCLVGGGLIGGALVASISIPIIIQATKKSMQEESEMVCGEEGEQI